MAWKRREEEWASASRKVILTLQQQYPLLFAIVALPIMHLIPTPAPNILQNYCFLFLVGMAVGNAKVATPPPGCDTSPIQRWKRVYNWLIFARKTETSGNFYGAV